MRSGRRVTRCELTWKATFLLRLKLCGEGVEVRFSERHMIDLQEMVKDHHADSPLP